MRNVPDRLLCLNIWFLDGGTVGGNFEACGTGSLVSKVGTSKKALGAKVWLPSSVFSASGFSER